MKRFIILFLLCLPLLSHAQLNLWDGVAETGKDTVVMISGAAADSVVSRWIEYNKWQEFEGKASLWSAAYSYFDGISRPVTIKYQTRTPDDNVGNYRLSLWTVLDSIKVSQDTQVRYGQGNQVGPQIDVASRAAPWSAHEYIRFQYNWSPAAADTVEISSIYSPVEK
jgi:hypothetical protein